MLTGSLGAGKTTFTQGLGAGLGVRGAVTSPTFVIARVHPSEVGGPALVHVDAYRLGGIDELDDLDLDTSLDQAVTVVEWGEGLAEGLSESRLEVNIVRGDADDGGRQPPRGDHAGRPALARFSFRGLGMITPLIAHVSDTHFGGPPDARARAEAVLAHLSRWTLDPTRSSCQRRHRRPRTAEEYAEARAVLDAWPGPKLVGTGNHDVREAFARGLLDARGRPARWSSVLEAADFRLLMLDSLVPARDGQRIDHGELSRGPARLARRAAGRATTSPTFVSLHHPPADIGLGLMAPILLQATPSRSSGDHEAPARGRHPRRPRAHRLRDDVRRPPAADRRRLRVDGPARRRGRAP